MAPLLDRRRRCLVTTLIFVALAARVAHIHYDRNQLYRRLVNKYDTNKKDTLMSLGDVVRLLNGNGVTISKEQFAQWAGRIDDEADGFDKGELLEAIQIFDDFGSAEADLVQFGHSASPLGLSTLGDILLLGVTFGGMMWLLTHTDAIEKRLAANSFVSAVKIKRLNHKWATLEENIEAHETEKTRLQDEMEELQSIAKAAEVETKNIEEQLQATKSRSDLSEERRKEVEDERLKQEAKEREVRRELEEKQRQLDDHEAQMSKAETELTQLRCEAEQHMKQAHMSTAKLTAMHWVLKGISAVGEHSPFKGAGSGQFQDDGAVSGFSIRNRGLIRLPTGQLKPGGPVVTTGFNMESFVFGYPTENDIVFYEVDKKRDFLGEGVDGAYRCRDIATGEKYALKIYDIGTRQKRQILNDLRTKQGMQDHPNIVKYHNVIETEKQIYVLMELIVGVDLFGHIVDNNGLSEKQACHLFAQMCEAMQFCHDNGIIHGDMKPENVMVTNEKSGAPIAKLIDFGFSCFLKYDDQDLGSSGPVCDVYSPPEALTGGSKVTKGVDLFRLGCTLYVMVMATFPFDRNCMDIEARRNGEVTKYAKWETLSEELRDLITRLCRDRIDIKTVMESKWIKDHYNPHM